MTILVDFILPMAVVVALIIIWGERSKKAVSKLSYQPRHNRLIVRRLDQTQPEAGQVFLPNSQRKPLNRGTVIAVGPDTDLKPGAEVEFFDFANTVDIDGEEYLLLRDEEIWGVRA